MQVFGDSSGETITGTILEDTDIFGVTENDTIYGDFGNDTQNAALDANDRIIYDQSGTDGVIYYDPVGTGAQAQIEIVNLETLR